MKEYIDINKCSTFEQFMIYIMCYLKEDDLRKDMNEYPFMPLGEMEFFNRFGIDWNDAKFIQSLVCMEDNDPNWKIENKFQEVANKAKELYDMLNEYDKK